MNLHDPQVKEVIVKLEKAILEDGRVDRAEAQLLLSAIKPLAGRYPDMADFVRILERVLEDGKVTGEESHQDAAY